MIRDLTEEEKDVKVSKDVKKLRHFEESLLKHYQAFLQVLENGLQGQPRFFAVAVVGNTTNRPITIFFSLFFFLPCLEFRRVKRKGNKVIKKGEDLSKDVSDAEKLAIIANKCMCDLLLRNTSFNFAKNLMASVVPRMCTQAPVQISEDCCETVRAVFVSDNHGEPSLEMVRLIAQLVKSKGFNVPPKVTPLFSLSHSLLLSPEINIWSAMKVVVPLINLRLLEEMEPPSMEPENQKKKGKKAFINKKKKKMMKEDKELMKDMKEAEAEFSKEEKQKIHTQTLKIVFHIYFRILKNMTNGPLLMAILRGLGKYAKLHSFLLPLSLITPTHFEIHPPR